MQRLLPGRNMKKLLKLKRRTAGQPIGRITNETVAEHRERILAGGRKFKYPIQYSRHRLVINTILISIATLVLLAGLGWWQLYPAQNTSEFMYRVTRVLPLPVAYVDGEPVRYSDYLMNYRSSEHYLQQKEQLNANSEDGKKQLEFVKRQVLDKVVDQAYAAKIARERNIQVTDQQIDDLIKEQRQYQGGTVSEEVYNASIQDLLGWDTTEYRRALASDLLRQQVAYALDDHALELKNKIAKEVKQSGADFQAIAASAGGEGDGKVTVGASGLVPRNNKDGGLALAAAKLAKGQVSDAVKTSNGDGYYFIRLVDSNDTQVSYEYIRVPLTEFDSRIAKLRADHKVRELISVPTQQPQTSVTKQ